MKILLRLPNWIGDAVMATPTLELLKVNFPNAIFSIVAPAVICELFVQDKRVAACYTDTTKQSKNRFFATYKLAKKIGTHDIAITFANNLFSALLLFWSGTPVRIGYAKNLRSFLLSDAIKPQKLHHQVLSYVHLLSNLIKIPQDIPNLCLVAKTLPKNSNKTRIGVSPGAAYGSAKMWLKEYFAEVVAHFLYKNCEVVLFGSKAELGIISDIVAKVERLATNKDILSNMINRVGQTSILDLVNETSALDLFITNDSGPLHIASALEIPLVAIFGPTPSATLPWKHSRSAVLNKKVDCAPCRYRVCPLENHICMKLITPDEVIVEAEKILKRID